MKAAGKGLTLIGAEGSCPPLPYIEVSASEGKALIGMGYAVEVKGGASAAPDAEAEAEAKAKAEAEAKAKAEAEAEADAKAKAEAEAEAADRTALIADAVLLVEPDGLESKGDRKGKPTIAAVQAITDLTDVTAEEIDAALAAHEAA